MTKKPQTIFPVICGWEKIEETEFEDHCVICGQTVWRTGKTVTGQMENGKVKELRMVDEKIELRPVCIDCGNIIHGSVKTMEKLAEELNHTP